METLSLVSEQAPLEHMGLNGYHQKAMEKRQSDLLELQSLDFFPAPSHPPPSFRIRTGSASSLCSDSYSISSSFSPSSLSSPAELVSPPAEQQGPPQIDQPEPRAPSIMPSPVRLKPSEVLQVGTRGSECQRIPRVENVSRTT